MKKKTEPMFKATKFFTISMACALLSQASYAKIQGVRTSDGPNTPTTKPSNGGGSSSSSGASVPDSTQAGNRNESCTMDQDASKYFPLDFFSNITRDGSSLTFEQRADNKVLVKIPAIIDTCGKFKATRVQNPKTKDVTIMMESADGKTYAEYVKCLEDKKLLKDGKVNHDEIAGKEYSEYSYIVDYDFDKSKDVKQSVKLSYGYPRSFKGKDGYAPVYGIDEDVAIQAKDNQCFSAEKIQPQVTYLNKGQDVMISELKEICRGGKAQEIAEARKAYGNADALKDIAEKIKAELDAGYLVAVQKDVERIKKDMEKIEDRLTKERDTIDEATSKKLTRQYADLTKELDNKFLNPAIARLDVLIKQRASLDEDDSRLKAIDDEIKKINEDVGAFSRRPNTAFASLYSVMEKYAITDSAKQIEDIRLKSYLYGKVYAGPNDDKRGKAISFEDANQKQFAGIQKFEKTLNDWTDQYNVGKGIMYPLQRTEKERATAIDSMNKRWNNYQVNEQKNLQKYCGMGMTGGVTNPVQCTAFRNGAQQRLNTELKKREKDLLFIKGRNEKLSKMSTSYNEYQKKQVDKETRDAEGYEPYGASYTNYENNFETLFPNYYGAPVSTAYNPALYQMGGQTAAMGNTGLFNPQMVNPQIPIQQGQFQMPQMAQQGIQTGGWPSI